MSLGCQFSLLISLNVSRSKFIPRLTSAFPDNTIADNEQQDNAEHDQQDRSPLILAGTADGVAYVAALHKIGGVVFDGDRAVVGRVVVVEAIIVGAALERKQGWAWTALIGILIDAA